MYVRYCNRVRFAFCTDILFIFWAGSVCGPIYSQNVSCSRARHSNYDIRTV
jgi:hypothetical protein